MMRTRILNALGPLSRQLLASSTMPVLSLLPRQLRLASSSATPVSKPVAERIAHHPALHCATCPFTAHERVYLKEHFTGGLFLLDEKLVQAMEKYHLIRAATAPTDYSGADSEQNYNARTQSLEAIRRQTEDLIKKLLIKQLAAKHEVSEREAKQIVQSLVQDVESVREQAQRRERREKGRQRKERQKKEQRKQRDYERESRGTIRVVVLGLGIALIGIYYLFESL